MNAIRFLKQNLAKEVIAKSNIEFAILSSKRQIQIKYRG